MKFLRESTVASVLLLIARLWLGFAWVTAGWGKITGGFDAGGFLTGVVGRATGENPTVQVWWANFINGFALPNVELFNFLVPWGQFLVGLGLILGTFTTFAALMGVVMNFSFILSGAVSTNPQMLAVGLIILVAGLNAGKLGADRWVIPYIRHELKDLFSRKDATQKT